MLKYVRHNTKFSQLLSLLIHTLVTPAQYGCNDSAGFIEILKLEEMQQSSAFGQKK
jgi:hypothetical protein